MNQEILLLVNKTISHISVKMPVPVPVDAAKGGYPENLNRQHLKPTDQPTNFAMQ